MAGYLTYPYSVAILREELSLKDWFVKRVLRLPLDDTLVSYARELEKSPTEFYTCHCTGAAQYAFMQPHMSRLHYLAGGESVEI